MKKNILAILFGLSLFIKPCFSEETLVQQEDVVVVLDVTDTSTINSDSEDAEEILDLTDVEIDVDNLPELQEMTFAQKLKLAWMILKIKSGEIKDNAVIHLQENGTWYVLGGVCFVGAGLITYYKIFR